MYTEAATTVHLQLNAAMHLKHNEDINWRTGGDWMPSIIDANGMSSRKSDMTCLQLSSRQSDRIILHWGHHLMPSPGSLWTCGSAR